MNPQRWQQIDEVFQQVVERKVEDRSAYLRSACGDDSELLREVRSLLDAHQRDAPYLEAPAHGGASRLLDLDARGDLTDPVGSRLGPWRITRALGAGGMGAVYLAVRDDQVYQKTAAIKLARRSLLGSSATRREELQRRFHIERQVLASLEHPYIARLLDGGAADDGRPYFVMEYVEGATIDAHCEQRSLSLRDRISLFIKVCEAVQHAHQNLVIHRDLKPGNILVTDEGVPKLLDFGLAKLLDPHGSAAIGGATATGEFMGTFAFAAPEQVSNTATPPDTRSDVYSLGMVLYRLLTGQHAYDVSGTMADVLSRITTQPPQPPSRINPAINDELDTIVLKALAKEPARRYQSAGDLRADLERFLRGEPILAKGDSGWYVLRKNVRRYRAPLMVAGAFVVLISTFAVVSALQARRLAQQKATLAESLRISNIERGRAMAMVGNTALAEQLIWPAYLDSLDDAAPLIDGHDDRLAYWALWELYLNEPCVRTFDPGFAPIQAMVCSSDGRWLTMTGREGRPVVIDALTAQPIRTIEQDASPWQSLCFKPGSSLLAVAGADGHAGVWDIETGVCTQSLKHDEPVWRVDYSRDGRRLLTSVEHAVFLWDAASGERLLRIAIDDTTAAAIAISPDNTRIGVGGNDGRLWLFDAATGEMVASFFADAGVPPGRRCGSVCFSPDGRFLAADTDGTAVAVIDLAAQPPQVIARLTDATGWIRALAFHPDHINPYQLAGAGFDKTVHVWEVAARSGDQRSEVRGQPASEDVSMSSAASLASDSWDCRLIRRYRGHNAPICAMQFAADGRHIISAGLERAVKVWELAQPGCLQSWPSPEVVFDMLFVPDGTRVLTAGAGSVNDICVRDANTGAILDTMEGHRGVVSSLAINPDGTRLASASYDRTIRVWPLHDPAASPLWTSPPHEHGLNSISWSPEGAEIAAASERGVIRIHRATDGELLRTIVAEATDRIPSMRFSPDGRFLAASLIPRNAIMLLDRRTGEQRQLTGHDQSIRIVRFSPDGSLLASAGDDLTVRLWSMREPTLGQCVQTLPGHHQDIFALAFSPDGTMLAASGRDGAIKLWSVVTGRCLATIAGHRDMIFSLAFSPDGRRLLAAGRDRAISVFDLSYYDRHIHGNLEYQRSQLRGD